MLFTKTFPKLDKPYRAAIAAQIAHLRPIIEALDGVNIAPDEDDVFRAFEQCPWDKLRVVLIGQDPYPTDGDADGLCFSSRSDKRPVSLINVFKALIESGIITEEPKTFDLSGWARQGVLMINLALTTVVGERGTHTRMWRPFMDGLVSDISRQMTDEARPLTFMLWGKNAQQLIPACAGHEILTWSHPSPLVRCAPDNQEHFRFCDHFTKLGSVIDWSKMHE